MSVMSRARSSAVALNDTMYVENIVLGLSSPGMSTYFCQSALSYHPTESMRAADAVLNSTEVTIRTLAESSSEAVTGIYDWRSIYSLRF